MSDRCFPYTLIQKTDKTIAQHHDNLLKCIKKKEFRLDFLYKFSYNE